jgi:hypothetical protein
LHATQAALHVVSQHTPSAQWPLAHSPPALHAEPLGSTAKQLLVAMSQ